MEKIQFDPEGAALKVTLQFEGLIVASYSFILWDAHSNTRLLSHIGNNQNTQDDVYELPSPVEDNDGRLIQLRTEFKALDPINVKQHKIMVEVYQGDELIGKAEEVGDNNVKAQGSLIFILLNKK